MLICAAGDIHGAMDRLPGKQGRNQIEGYGFLGQDEPVLGVRAAPGVIGDAIVALDDQQARLEFATCNGVMLTTLDPSASKADRKSCFGIEFRLQDSGHLLNELGNAHLA